MKTELYQISGLTLAAYLVVGVICCLADMCEHQALQLAGLAVDGSLSDALTWRLVRVLDASHRRATRHLRAITHRPRIKAMEEDAVTHPAIDEFVRRLRAGNR